MIKYWSLNIVFGISAAILVIAFSLFYVKLADVEHLLIIHFESLSGVDFLGSTREIWGILISGLALNFINFFVAIFLHHRNQLLSRLIGITNVIISGLILLTITVIISVN